MFWKMHASFLKNDRPTAEMFLGMLKDESKTVCIKDEIGPVHYERYEKMKELMGYGAFGRLYGVGSTTPLIESSGAVESDGHEDEFHKKLMANKIKFYDCLGINNSAILAHEVEMDPYGRCDFVIREGRMLWVIECKMGEAKSSAVSQIDKYRLAMELEMSLGLHDQVHAVVIAENFSAYVAGELSRLAVQMVKHGGSPESLRKV